MGLVALGSVHWVHESGDRHSAWAGILGAVTAVRVAIGAAVVLPHGKPELAGDLAYAAIGALVGSQVYAAVTSPAP